MLVGFQETFFFSLNLERNLLKRILDNSILFWVVVENKIYLR